MSENAKVLEAIPKTVSQSIPYIGVYENGMMQVQHNKFSKSYRLPDINFKTANNAEQEKIAEQYKAFLVSFDKGVDIQITLYNKTVDIENFKKRVFLEFKNDELNEYREEYNQMLLGKMQASKNNLETEKYMTISLMAENAGIAQDKFIQIDAMISDSMATLTKFEVKPMTLIERLSVLNTIYNSDAEESLYERRTINGKTVESFSLENCVAQGITTKEVISPSYMEFNTRNMIIGDRVAKSYYINNYPTYIKGTILTDFANIPCNMLVSVIMRAQDQSVSIDLTRNTRTNASSEILNAQKKASRSGYDPNLISSKIKDVKDEADELLEGLTRDNEKFFTTTFVCTLFANDMKELKAYEEQLKLIANKNLISIRSLDGQMEDGFATSLPLGVKKVEIDRLMSSETVSGIVPFSMMEVSHKHGMYYGLNAESKNMIVYDRGTGLNYNACILGQPGAGKSFAAKREMLNILLNTTDEIFAIDPDREYGVIARELNSELGADEAIGEVIRFAAGSNYHINPFDLNIKNVDDEDAIDPVSIKCSFIRTICEIMIGGKFGLSPIEESLIDRCTISIYKPYLEHLKRTGKFQDNDYAPTFKDFYNELAAQELPEAQNLALSLEKYVEGSEDIFAHRTNVKTNCRLTVYDIKDLNIGSMELGLQICLDNIWNKIIENKLNNKRTWVYIDEFHTIMRKQSSAEYVSQIFKRARKWDAYPTAITQNVEDMLKSEEARTIINNSSFVTLLGQTPINKQKLSAIYELSPTEEKYISTAKPGMGILVMSGNNIIPMNDDFPKDTKLYKIMTSKPDERIII